MSSPEQMHNSKYLPREEKCEMPPGLPHTMTDMNKKLNYKPDPSVT